MSCEHLVCASCAGPVDEGRCPTCRAAHASLHPHGPTLSPQLVASCSPRLGPARAMLLTRLHG